MKPTIFAALILLITNTVYAQELNNFLLPQPKSIAIGSNNFNHIGGTSFQYNDFIDLIEKTIPFNITGTIKSYNSPLISNSLNLLIDSTLTKNEEYSLTIDSTTITIKGKDETALHYGKQTLKQIITYNKFTGNPIPCLSIKDWPDFERRGYMLDISRDKVPTMKTLYRIIDLLASWKINEFQLYTEHTFAYKNHEVVWKDCGPLNAEEIRKLDIYCKSKFIDLVPNQNSFGHMENWLKHDEYLHLAECPTDCETIWGARSRHSLNPINPESFKLMQELYNELLPNFTSKYFNIGCDETVELGLGLSKEECDKKGKGVVYLDFVKKLNQEANNHNHIAQFWGDIVLKHPELIKDIPKNMITMVWGYTSTHPFEEDLPKFKNAGLDFYVCPGTSTWRSEIGRNHDAFINLKNAAKYGKINGAKGYLNTNWGDWGHWQPLSVCYPTMAIGSAYSWNSDYNSTKKLNLHLDAFVFNDITGNLSKGLLQLSNAYLDCKIPEGNANAFHLMLRRYKWSLKGHYQTKHLKIYNLEEAKSKINSSIELLKNSNPQCEDASIIFEEIIQASNLAKHGIHLGIARLNAKEFKTENINSATKQELIKELESLIKIHENLWLERNRKGGLQFSKEKLEGLLEFYKNNM